MRTVSAILSRKGPQVLAIGPDATVLDAIRKMAEYNVGALVVTAQERLVGIISERDYARKVILRGRSSAHTTVREIMTQEVVTAEPEWDMKRCMRVMTDRRFRHLPVQSQGRLLGLVSMGDVVKAIIDEQTFIIQQLEQYMQVQVH
ncbi:MAG: CBS domain-containing protein [Planctomycetes bacterium]|nr:CBS domain-containing protein [Planctomycetota bacterium]